MYQLVIYIPETHVETVKNALFRAGAGRYRNYDSCCWQTAGRGQFRPLPGSRAFIGTEGQTESLTEIRLELLCPEDRLAGAIRALKEAHPYEEPAYHAYKIVTEEDLP